MSPATRCSRNAEIAGPTLHAAGVTLPDKPFTPEVTPADSDDRWQLPIAD
jgi:hypothetical protein